MSEPSGALVTFDVVKVLPLSPAESWRRLSDWKGHGAWIPLTRMQVNGDDPSHFTAWSGVGPIQLEDRMHASATSFDGSHGEARVEKLGPVLVGHAVFSVAPGHVDGTSVVHWYEEVRVRHLPRFLVRPVAVGSAWFFGTSLRRMVRRG